VGLFGDESTRSGLHAPADERAKPGKRALSSVRRLARRRKLAEKIGEAGR